MAIMNSHSYKENVLDIYSQGGVVGEPLGSPNNMSMGISQRLLFPSHLGVGPVIVLVIVIS